MHKPYNSSQFFTTLTLNLLGHQKTHQILIQDLNKNKLAKSYILTGESHIGKTTFLLEFAKILQCKKKNNCGTCPDCLLSNKESHPDITIIDDVQFEKDSPLLNTNLKLKERKTNMILLEDIQEIKKRLFKTSNSNYNIVVISNIERMNTNSANSLLKILEEPPSPKTLFLFSITDEQNILPTISSRCRILNTTPPTKEALKDIIQKVFPQTEDQNKYLPFLSLKPGLLIQLQNEEKMENIKNVLDPLLKVFKSKDEFQFSKYSQNISSNKEAFKIIKYIKNYIQWLWNKNDQKKASHIKFQKLQDTINLSEKYLKCNVSTKNVLQNLFLELYKII